MQYPNYSQRWWQASEQEAIPQAAQIADPLPKGFPQMHFKPFKLTLIRSPKLKALNMPVPKSFTIPTKYKSPYARLDSAGLHALPNTHDKHAHCSWDNDRSNTVEPELDF